MKNPKQQVSQSRRKFLRDTSISGGAAAVAVSVPGVALAEQPDGGPGQKKTEQGYRLTEHILAYYKSAAS